MFLSCPLSGSASRRFCSRRPHEATVSRQRWRWGGHGLKGRLQWVDYGINRSRHGLRFPLEVDLHLGEIERVETHFDGLAGKLRRNLVELSAQHEGGITAHESIQAIEEQTSQIGRRRELTNMFNVSLPAQQGSGSQAAVFGTVIDLLNPNPQALVQLFERNGSLRIQIGKKLFPQRSKKKVNLDASLDLVRWGVNDEDPNRGGDAR